MEQNKSILFDVPRQSTILHDMTPDLLKEMIGDMVNKCNILSDLPDFEIQISQAQTILGVSYPTIKTYMSENLLTNISSDSRRAKFSFYQVVELRRNNPKYQRFRTLIK